MNLKLRTASCCFLISIFTFAQVGISKNQNSTFEMNSNASLHLDGLNPTNSSGLGLILPNVSQKENLPLFDSTSPDSYQDDPTLEGMILYDKKTSSVHTYVGDKWENDKSVYVDPKLKQSRFLGKGDSSDQQSVVCVLLLACGRHQGLQFSHAIDGEHSYNNLNITRDKTTIKYLGINYDYPNSKFVINEAGTYEIRVNLPTYIAGVVSLTEGASYQIYAFKKDETGTHKEILLSSVVPNFPGVLGIGGGSSAGVGIATTIALNPGDYVYTMIHSPSVTVSVGSELRAWDKSLYNPREILFTKID